jgi:hypothetical protein
MATDLNIKVNLDNMTIGDLELLDSRRVSDILSVCDRVIVKLNGATGEEIPAALRKLHWTAIREVAEAISSAANQTANAGN